MEINARLFRQYPQGELFSHVVGLHRPHQPARRRSSSRNPSNSSNYRGTDHIGKIGIEQRYERQLHGTTGVEEVEVDAGGRAVRSLSRSRPASGNNLVLTLDAKLQEIAYRAFGDFRGALVAIEPRNGGVLAFVSKPGFDPNLFVDGIDPQNWIELNNSPDKPMNNRALAGHLSAGVHLQAVHGARRARASASAVPQLHHQRSRVLHAGRSRAPVPRLEKGRPWRGGHAQVAS